MDNPNRLWWGMGVLLAAANALILAETAVWLRYGAAVILLLALPGVVWQQAVFRLPVNWLVQITFAVGLSLALTITGAMLAVYLAGPLTRTTVLVLANVIILPGLLLAWRRRPGESAGFQVNARLWAALIIILLLALALRLPRLGYAEFHEDEAEALMLGVRLLQGEDYALFLHRKGPAQMLIPLALWLLTGHLTEAMARFPFALSSLFSALTIFWLGRRWFGLPAGLLAALLWAANGYAIAFGRMVQYQALIFFMGLLAIYALYLAWSERQPRLQILAALLLAASLLAHFDALLLLPAAGYLVLAITLRLRHTHLRRQLLNLSLSLSLFLFLLAAFYVPYALDPEFQNTTAYLSESRVKPGLLYNNLDRLRRLDRDYSSQFYLPLLALGLLGAVLAGNRLQVTGDKGAESQGRRGAGAQGLTGSREQTTNDQPPNHPTTHPASQPPTQPTHASRITHYSLLITFLLLAAATFFWPGLWQVGELSLALGPWLLLLAVCFWTAPTVAQRAAWLLFGAPLVGYVFLVEDPRTHLYILYPGAVLLAGAGLPNLRFWIDDLRLTILDLRLTSNPAIHKSKFALRNLGRVGLVIWLGLIMVYEAAIFLPSESTFARLRAGWEESLWELVYDDLPRPREYFGYPKREGWKTIGALRAEGRFPGDYRGVNEEFVIPIWYTFGEGRSCYDTPAHFFIRLAELADPALPEGYRLNGQIEREGEVRLQIASRPALASSNEIFDLANYVAAFDRLATPERFARQNEPDRPVRTRFGPAIEFTGYDLSATTAAPGDTLYLELYWRALAPPGDRYRAFVHLTDGSTLWAQQDDDPACRLPTTIWRAGQHSLGQFRLVIDPATPPGRYPLIIGLYQAETLERLKISAGAGQIGDDFLWLGDIEVGR